MRRTEFVGAAGDPTALSRHACGRAAANLKEALSVYRNLCHWARLQSHAAGYAFAQERVEAYRAQGYSEREARAATSQDLGHGDGSGRYIASVNVRPG
jgi:hypothetical protein